MRPLHISSMQLLFRGLKMGSFCCPLSVKKYTLLAAIWALFVAGYLLRSVQFWPLHISNLDSAAPPRSHSSAAHARYQSCWLTSSCRTLYFLIFVLASIEVPQTTYKYLKVPRHTSKFLGTPQSTYEYLKVP